MKIKTNDALFFTDYSYLACYRHDSSSRELIADPLIAAYSGVLYVPYKFQHNGNPAEEKIISHVLLRVTLNSLKVKQVKFVKQNEHNEHTAKR